MKKKIILINIAILAFIFSLFIFNPTSYAGSQDLNNLTYTVKLNEDGSADITEIWDIYVYDTNTLFKTFDLDSSKFGKIIDVKVAEINENGTVTDFLKTDTYAYHVQKGYYYALNTKSNEFEIAWGVSINSSATKKYKISYKVTDAIKTYNDCSEFYWMFISTSNGIPADKVTGTIKLPKAVANKENIKVWAHGPLQGEIYATDNETVSFTVTYLDTGTMVEARVAVLENIFPTNTNKVNENKLQSIVAEETEWADSANRERDRIKKETEREKMIEKIIGIALYCIGFVIFGIFLVKIIKYIRILSEIKKPEPETKVEYFRDFPDENATPGEAAFLYYFDKYNAFSKNTSKIVSAIMLNLAQKKMISFEQDEKGKMVIDIKDIDDTSVLKADEQSIYDLLKEVKKYTIKKCKDNELLNDIKISMKDIEKYAKNNDRTFLAKVEGLETNVKNLQETVLNYNKSKSKEAEKWKNKAQGYFMAAFMCLCFAAIVLPLFAVIPCLICGFICNKIAKKTRFYALTQKGSNEQELWKGLKRYMENFSLLNEREVPELALWEKYLVYATAFGIADKVLDQLKVQYPQLNDEDYMMNNGYSYIYMMNRYNFDRVLNSSIQRAYQAGARERAARQAAASSSYSSGGGRRRRLLRRRRTAAEAGGRNGRKIERR